MENTIVSSKPELITQLEKAWAGDLDTLLSLYAEECVFEDKAFDIRHEGHQGIREVFEFSFSMMPDFRVSYSDYVVAEDRAAAPWTFTGSFSGEFEGKTYSNVPVRIDGVSFMRLANGKITHNADYWNLPALAAQLPA
jgi:steroid delta-isomerase-like uncharacterized protein